MARARKKEAENLSDEQIDEMIPEEYENEGDAWKRAFRWAYRKGNRFTEADVQLLSRDPEVVRAGQVPTAGDPTKACVVFANSHAPNFEDGESPVKVED